MLSSIAILLLGFVLLIKGADIFVDASVAIAKRFNLPNVIIALTIIAMGTSAPEVVISATSALGGYNEIAVGNIIGSNIFNLIFVVGICAVIKAFEVNFKEVSRGFWISILSATALLLMWFIFPYEVPRLASVGLLVAFSGYIMMLIKQVLRNKEEQVDEEENKGEEESINQKPLYVSIGFAVAGLALIILGGDLTVDHAVNIAYVVGISERVIGLTIIAIGTSLPELVTSIIACKRGETSIAVGSMVGSNIFNILFVLGIAGVITPLVINDTLLPDLIVLIVGSLLTLFFVYTNRRVSRFEGSIMVTLYLAYIGYVIFI